MKIKEGEQSYWNCGKINYGYQFQTHAIQQSPKTTRPFVHAPKSDDTYSNHYSSLVASDLTIMIFSSIQYQPSFWSYPHTNRSLIYPLYKMQLCWQGPTRHPIDFWATFTEKRKRKLKALEGGPGIIQEVHGRKL